MNATRTAPARRTEEVGFSPVRLMMERARSLEAAGADVIHLEIGEPDFDTPTGIVDATIAALRDRRTHYGPNRGALALRRAIARTLLRDKGLEYSPDEEILITVGAAEAVFAAVLAYVDPGDEVIIPSPAFMNYGNAALLAGAKPVYVPLNERANYALDIEAVRRALTPRSKMLIVNNPHNPTGTLFSSDDLAALARLAAERDILVVSDEVYDRIVYEGAPCRSIASFPGMRERTLVVDGFSKCYAMTGWRLGYLAAPAVLIPPILKLHQYTVTCGTTFSQEGLAAAMEREDVEAETRRMVDEFAGRRALVLEKLAGITGLEVNRPRGAFYALINVGATGLDGDVFALRLLEEEAVATVPCGAFGRGFDQHIRISYAAPIDRLRLGLDRIAAFAARLLPAGRLETSKSVAARAK